MAMPVHCTLQLPWALWSRCLCPVRRESETTYAEQGTRSDGDLWILPSVVALIATSREYKCENCQIAHTRRG